MRSLRSAWFFALIAFVALFASALADPAKTIVHTTLPVLRPMLPIAVPPSSAPANASFAGAVPDGTHVAMSRLPRLPMRTAMNTATPKNWKRVRPMAANGAYIDITNTNCGGSGALGDQFNVGCTLSWHAANMPSVGHTYQDYVVLTGNANELLGSATAVGGTFTNNSDTSHNTTLSPAGTYVFGVYDATAAQWVAVIYVNAGQVFAVKVFSDPSHTQETYQFDATGSAAAYIYLQNVSASDYYVVGITQTSVSPGCVFMAPAPLPSPYTYPAHNLCQLTASTGVQAPGNNLSVTWPIGTSYTAGVYSVEVYDITAGVRLGQVQVSITGASGLVLITKPDISGPNANPSPAVAPAATPATIFDWDGTNPMDESVTGMNASISGVTNGTNYLWTLSDPQGQVLATQPGTISGSVGNATFTFDNLLNSAGAGTGPVHGMLAPGQYPANSFTVQLYDTTHSNVIASQAFKVLGYSTLTQFLNAGVLGTTTTVSTGGGATVTSMQFTNNSSAVFNGFGDSLSKIVFSSGADFNVSSTTGNGIMLSVINGAAGPCNTTCSAPATDSLGNQWTANVTCSAGGSTKNGECNIELDPVGASTTLPPGAYITLNNVSFFNATGSQCGNVCQALTSELPSHGLKWSNTSSPIAWQPVYFRNGSSAESGTASFSLVGSLNQNTRNAVAGPPFSGPIVGTHWYRDPFLQADYNANSPFNTPVSSTLSASNDDIYAWTITDTGTNKISEVAIQFPPLLNPGTLDSATTGWSVIACPATFNSQWVCFSSSAQISSGGSSTIWIDEPPALQSFPFVDFQMQALAQSQWFSLTPTAGSVSTPDGQFALDTLAIAQYSLIGTDMTTTFNPTTVGQGSTATLGATITNTSTSLDPNPDSLDLVVLEAPSTGLTLNNTPTVANAGWSYLGSIKLNSGTTTQYWFGLCASQFANGAQQGASYGGPPQANASPIGWPLTNPYKNIGTCANETSAARSGQTITISNMQFTNFTTTGTQVWHMYAHGANVGGWSAPQPFNLTVTAESAATWFNQINGVTTTVNTVPSIGGSPNTYQYAIKNTSQSSAITKTVITLPGLDINNQNATDSSGQTWQVTNIITGGVTLSAPGGQTDGTGGCTVDTTAANTFNPTTAGANGQITIKGCTNFKPGDTIYVNFQAASPQSQSDTYAFPATVDGNAAGAQWLGSNEITVSFTLGLDVVVNPSNPGPGASTPVVNCGNPCAFSGNTVDFGNITNNQSFTFGDVVRASLIYTGATTPGHNLQLYVSANQNPINSTGAPANEMLTATDAARSSSGAGITFNQTTLAVVPTTTPGMLLATAPETYRTAPSSGAPYDILQNYQITIGNEAISGHIVTVTYTLIAN